MRQPLQQHSMTGDLLLDCISERMLSAGFSRRLHSLEPKQTQAKIVVNSHGVSMSRRWLPMLFEPYELFELRIPLRRTVALPKNKIIEAPLIAVMTRPGVEAVLMVGTQVKVEYIQGVVNPTNGEPRITLDFPDSPDGIINLEDGDLILPPAG